MVCVWLYDNAMKSYAIIHKSIGETPLQALELFRKKEGVSSHVLLTYAGRLDPMAEGKLLILIGEECKKRERYHALDKAYTFEILLGMTSDTGDVLGIAEEKLGSVVTDYQAKRALRNLVGGHVLPYPAFSSKTVDGLPLFEHALSGTLDRVRVPQRHMNVYAASYERMYTVQGSVLLSRITQNIRLLRPQESDTRLGRDFRKGEILARWHELLQWNKKEYTILVCRAVVSSGTYIRALAPLVARMLGTDGLAYSINRTDIGTYVSVLPGIGFWWKKL